nr:uncharacterized protein LOC104119887 isoform X4 [Nicotiana tomentosiformis]
MRKQDTEGLNLAENAIVVVPEQATSSLYKAGFPKQTALTIRESYALLEKAASHQLCATTSRDNYKYASNRFARIFRVSITTTLHFQSWS